MNIIMYKTLFISICEYIRIINVIVFCIRVPTYYPGYNSTICLDRTEQ